jgi:electron transfer flavoprotein alpha/beta subunit
VSGVRAVALVHQPEDLALVRLATGLGETLVVSVAAPSEAIEQLLQQARTAGAVRTVRLWDDAMQATDYLGVAFTLAATVRAVLGDLAARPTVVLCGDGGRGAVGPAVAERLGLPHLGEVVGASMMDDRVVARRRSGTVVRLYAGKPPSVLCVAAAPTESPAAEAGGWTSAVGETEVWTLGQAGLTGAELSYRKRFKPHPSLGPVGAPRLFADVAQLAARLQADGLLSGR